MNGELPEPQQDEVPEQPERERDPAPTVRARPNRPIDLEIPPNARTIKGLRDRRRVVE